MHPNPRRILPILVLLALAGLGYWYLYVRPAGADTGALRASGSIEALSISISPELGGRVVAVGPAEGDTVTAGTLLVQLDTSLLEAQRAQAEAAASAAGSVAEAAQAAAVAAQANYDLLAAGPSPEQLAVAQTVVDRAQVALDAAQEAYDALPDAARDMPDGKALSQQVNLAEAGLENARAQYDLAAAGARPEQLDAAQAQLAATQAQAAAAADQATAAAAAVTMLDVQIAKLSITAPVDGVVLSRAVQPGEVASPGAVLLVLGQLDYLTITVYVPEDRLGNVRLGQVARVGVDSFPDKTFPAVVKAIAGEAEFTPRNVQTVEGRKSTVFAVELAIDNSGGRLKPGMPADVEFSD